MTKSTLISITLVAAAVVAAIGYQSFTSEPESVEAIAPQDVITSPVAQQARVQIEMPNGEKLDVSEIQLLETRMIGDRDTHILNLKGVKLGGTWKMPKIIGKL